ncbi:Translin [Leucosporidium creatinivorum]|uniref:Translin n=1 Tax=Leucosporidium creatinivorum TaxID=106004 RepID=A0A1Y2FWL1_9BASI|nr:Translin [Leucosporidium creatinivorum]
MSASSPVDFSYLKSSLEADAELREQIREAVRGVESTERACLAVLNRVHSVGKEHTAQVLSSLTPLLPPLRASLAALATLIPSTQFYRYSSSFSQSLQNASFIVVFSRFLEREDVPTKEEVGRELEINPEWRDKFFLPTEEYLHSLISLLNELSRLAVNRVTLGDYSAPVQYSKFSKELSTAFGLLNLKNDSLRKRFDGIKYDVKKLEEVVYDLSLRGLLPTQTTAVSQSIQEEQGDWERSAKRARGENEA